MLYTVRLCGRSGRRCRPLAFFFLVIMSTGILKISEMIVYNSRERESEREREREREREIEKEEEAERANERAREINRNRYWSRHRITHSTDRQTHKHPD